MRILIVNITRIGDQLQTSPTIVGLKERYPDAEVTVLGDVHHMEVCYGIPGVDRVYELDVNRIGQDLFAGGTGIVDAYRYVEHVVRDLRGFGFDLAFNFSSSRMSSAFMRLLRIPDCRGWMMDSEGNRLIVNPWSRLRVASILNRRYAPYNLVDSYCRVAGVRPREHRLWYTPTEEGKACAAQLLSQAGVRAGERVIALQPGASDPIRQWPASYLGAVGRLLRERLGTWILLVGSAADKPLCEQIAAQIGEGVLVTAGRTDLSALAALLARSSLLVTGDTGPMHVAAAMGTPIVAFYFGPAYVWETGPYCADSIAFQTRIACSPCNHAVRCLAPVCRDELTPETVFWAVHDRIAEDYVALGRRARGWPGVDVYRIRFDAEGMCEPIPLAPRFDANEAFRLLYREMWRAAFDGTDDEEAAMRRISERWCAGPGSRKAAEFSAQRNALEQLRALAGHGEMLAGRLLKEAEKAEPSLEALEAINAQIEELDGEIARQGYIEEAVAILSSTFALAKENRSETRALDILSQETIDLYGELRRWASLSVRFLDAIEARHAQRMSWGSDRAGIGASAEACQA
jgi:ADP-heptose:LPS heptosyltransferase